MNENFRQKRSMHTTRQGFLLLQGAKQDHRIHLVSKGQELLATARRRLASITRIAESMRSQDAASGDGTLHVQLLILAQSMAEKIGRAAAPLTTCSCAEQGEL